MIDCAKHLIDPRFRLSGPYEGPARPEFLFYFLTYSQDGCTVAVEQVLLSKSTIAEMSPVEVVQYVNGQVLEANGRLQERVDAKESPCP